MRDDVFATPPTSRGSRWLRVVLLKPLTDASTLGQVFDGIEVSRYSEWMGARSSSSGSARPKDQLRM
ncbi:hypothetical protein [Haloarchaeobius salinus]|uniref:hypothetical protein n=1 Tax=Haloarchaeobius salinus TaxID=1198298 RepID=UPI00210AB3DD|nr:hypothetical protein [Haloarchaeobius salinus]